MSNRYGPVPGVTNHYGTTGFGVLGATIRANTATGQNGPGLVYGDLSSAGLDDAKEYLAQLKTAPAAGALFLYEDGSFDFTGAPDGSYSLVYELLEDFVSLGDSPAIPLNIGVANATATATGSGSTATAGAVVALGGSAGAALVVGASSAAVAGAVAASGASAVAAAIAGVQLQALAGLVGASGGLSSAAVVIGSQSSAAAGVVGAATQNHFDGTASITGTSCLVAVGHALARAANITPAPARTFLVAADNPDLMQWAEKDKDARLDFAFNWADWVAHGDKIIASTWEADPGINLEFGFLDGALSVIWVSGGAETNWYALTNTVTSADGRIDQRVLRIFVPADIKANPTMGSALFPNRFAAVASVRSDRLALAAAGIMPQVTISDDYIWEKLLAAESTIAGMLRVPLRPTKFFPTDPTPEQIAALPAGMPYEVDQPYDYDPANYRGDRWGYTVLRQKPVISVDKVRFVYPAQQHVVLDVPPDWVRVDRKYGHLQFVPTSSPFLSPIGGLVMNSMAGGRQLPFAVEVEYTAGLKDVQTKFPELISLVKKKAVTMIVEDAFLPSSGSISADGLSQSLSVNLGDYHDSIDRAINGGDGANGGLMTKIHGIRMMVI